MELGTIIHDLLANDAAVAAIVGTQIYPEESPDDVDLELIVYSVRVGDLVDGTALVATCTVTVHGYTDSDDGAQALGVAILNALDGKGGQNGTTRLRSLALSGWDEARSFEENLWGRLLTFAGTVIRG